MACEWRYTGCSTAKRISIGCSQDEAIDDEDGVKHTEDKGGQEAQRCGGNASRLDVHMQKEDRIVTEYTEVNNKLCASMGKYPIAEFRWACFVDSLFRGKRMRSSNAQDNENQCKNSWPFVIHLSGKWSK
eukprot:1143892-Pelagomonas_calceolata.AAC.8